jgi:prepilin-type N-terminal cleavage/methylation domain-containing protein
MLKRIQNMTISRVTNTMKRKGFTLIELLTVMAIIGVLASLLIVGMQTARQKARIAKAEAEVKLLAQAWKSYWLIFGEWPASCAGVSDKDMTGVTMKILMGDNDKNLKLMEPNPEVLASGFKDPWSKLYKVDFSQNPITQTETYQTTVFLPNAKRYAYDY